MNNNLSLLQRLGFWLVLSLVFIISMFPLFWILTSSFKTRADVISTTPTYIPFVQYQPTLDNYKSIFISPIGDAAQSTASQNISVFRNKLLNSVIITALSTLLAVLIGTLTAYAISRYNIIAKDDLMFFILSTRMLPPIVVLIPIFVLFSNLGLKNSYLGLSLLYISMNLPFVVWIMKGFFDEIPVEYEEAAMIDGYSRLQAIYKIVIPEALPAMAATAVFSMIISWNEFVFANFLNRDAASTVPPFLNSIIGVGAVEWSRLAAASVIFVLPIVIFTFLVRNHLLRGVTFGAVRR